MFWRDLEGAGRWYDAPLETQSIMIELFDEVAQDTSAVNECKIWLLKQKQTQAWSTTKATSDAVYALLLRGERGLPASEPVSVELGGVRLGSETGVVPTLPEPGTGFFERHFRASEVRSALGEVRTTKTDPGISWGSLHWQYFTDISEAPAFSNTPPKLTKKLFVKRNSPAGPTLDAIQEQVNVGDELVVRIELQVDRDMEFVHLKDQRGSGTEPVNVLSGYRWQDALGYYESTRDTASHFFIDSMPKGHYVFEYSTRVQLRGEYQMGIAEIQCMYAPEFRAHSASQKLVVR